MTWNAMSASERDAVRVWMLELLLPVRRNVLQAGLAVRADPRLNRGDDEKRTAAEFEAMVREGLK
jgi:hypothetical protein